MGGGRSVLSDCKQKKCACPNKSIRSASMNTGLMLSILFCMFVQ